MRLRSFGIIIATVSVAAGTFGVSYASARQMIDPPPTAAPSSPTASPVPAAAPSPAPVSSTDTALAEMAPAPCPPTSSVGASPLPGLSTDLAAAVSTYAEDPSSWDADTWMDSGGPAGGGVPASAVAGLMRHGLAAGLSDEQVRSFLEPGFLRGMGDPGAGARLIAFIGEQDDPTLIPGLASYAQALSGRHVSPMSAQTDLFEAFPVLRAAYMSLAHAVPPDLATAEGILTLANQGYRPAQDSVQSFIAAGNHPSAGAQSSGGIPDLMRAEVYDLFVADYAGPLTPDAAAAVANRLAYRAWVDRIATWDGAGADIDQVPQTAEFSGPGGFTSSGGSTSGANAVAC